MPRTTMVSLRVGMAGVCGAEVDWAQASWKQAGDMRPTATNVNLEKSIGRLEKGIDWLSLKIFAAKGLIFKEDLILS